jgi:hypothetical protein
MPNFAANLPTLFNSDPLKKRIQQFNLCVLICGTYRLLHAPKESFKAISLDLLSHAFSFSSLFKDKSHFYGVPPLLLYLARCLDENNRNTRGYVSVGLIMHILNVAAEWTNNSRPGAPPDNPAL